MGFSGPNAGQFLISDHRVMGTGLETTPMGQLCGEGHQIDFASLGMDSFCPSILPQNSLSETGPDLYFER